MKLWRFIKSRRQICINAYKNLAFQEIFFQKKNQENFVNLKKRLLVHIQCLIFHLRIMIKSHFYTFSIFSSKIFPISLWSISEWCTFGTHYSALECAQVSMVIKIVSSDKNRCLLTTSSSQNVSYSWRWTTKCGHVQLLNFHSPCLKAFFTIRKHSQKSEHKICFI